MCHLLHCTVITRARSVFFLLLYIFVGPTIGCLFYVFVNNITPLFAAFTTPHLFICIRSFASIYHVAALFII
jgi:hypothetical protein